MATHCSLKINEMREEEEEVNRQNKVADDDWKFPSRASRNSRKKGHRPLDDGWTRKNFRKPEGSTDCSSSHCTIEESVAPNESSQSGEPVRLTTHDIKQYWLVVQCGWIMGWVAPGGGGRTTMHCARCVRSNFSSSLAPSHASERASEQVRARILAFLSPSLSACPLCPFVLSSPRLSVLTVSLLHPSLSRPIIIAVSLSLLPSISRFFPMAMSSLKAASRSAGIQPRRCAAV